MSSRLPGVRGVANSSHDVITAVPLDRWDADSIPDSNLAGRFGGFVDAWADFDAAAFGVTPSEAALMDPQQRALLEVIPVRRAASVGWSSMGLTNLICVHAGHMAHAGGWRHGRRPDGCSGGHRKARRAGCDGRPAGGGQQLHRHRARPQRRCRPPLLHPQPQGLCRWPCVLQSMLLCPEPSMLDRQGPSVSLDTACSSSLVTTHFVGTALRTGGCSRGLSAGVNLPMNWETSAMFVGAGMTAADGRCKTLDAAADGYVRSEACVAVLFGCGLFWGFFCCDDTSSAPSHSVPAPRRGAADDVTALAILLGTAVNQDGRSSSLTAPNGPSQQQACYYSRPSLQCESVV